MTEPTERELAAVAAEVARGRAVTAPKAFRSGLRVSLIVAAPSAPARPAFAVWPRTLALRPVLAVLVTCAVLVAAGGSAAASSLPGDAAFGLKRAVEEAQVTLAADDPARLDLLLAQSDSRIADLASVLAHRPTAIAAAAEEYLAAAVRVEAMAARVAAQPATAAREAALARAQVRSTDHLAMLRWLAAELPASAQHGIERAIEVQQSVHGKVDQTPSRPAAPTAPSAPTAAPGRPSASPGREGRPSGTPVRP
jgi:hypothetical protein